MLTFPTIAEQVLAKFNLKTKTVSLSTLALQRGAFREYDYPKRIFTFDDDSRLIATGTGKQLKTWTELP